MRALFFLFIVMPIVEMWLLIQVGSQIGAFNTITLVLLTAALGAWMLREQGLSTLFRFNQRLEQGELPAKEILEGLLLAIGGALLMTPGFITDAIGFACLIPVTRSWLVDSLMKRGVVTHFQRSSYTRRQNHHAGPGPGPRVHTDREGHNVIDGEYKRDD
jgi:UPF0716 protein FxsA